MPSEHSVGYVAALAPARLPLAVIMLPAILLYCPPPRPTQASLEASWPTAHCVPHALVICWENGNYFKRRYLGLSGPVCHSKAGFTQRIIP